MTDAPTWRDEIALRVAIATIADNERMSNYVQWADLQKMTIHDALAKDAYDFADAMVRRSTVTEDKYVVHHDISQLGKMK